MALPFVLRTTVILLEQETEGVRERALALFAGKAQRAIGLRGEVAIFITGDAELRRMNRQYRHKDEPTDVLTFELWSERANRAGDMAISAEMAAANAAELGHSAETELKILILHGLLHLAGYDHENDNGKMQAREAELRLHLKLPVAGLIERTHASGTTRSRPRKGSGR